MSIIMRKKESKFKEFLKKDEEKDRSGFIAAIIINVIIWFIVNNIVNWNLSFISPTFVEVLGILNLLIISTIIINFIFLFYQPTWFRNMLHVVTDILSIIVLYTFLKVFPFILNDFLALVVVILIVLGILGAIIGLIIHLLKFVFGFSD